MIRLQFLILAMSLAVSPWGMGTTSLLAQDKPSAEAISVKIEALVQIARLGHPFGSSARSSVTLGRGESGKIRLGTKECRAFSGGGGNPDPGSITWYLGLTLEEADWNQYTLNYNWSREDAGSSAELFKMAEEQGRISLRHDQSLPIDLARIRQPSGKSCDVYVTLGAHYEGPAEYAHQAVRHEVWLTHTNPTGLETSSRLDLVGKQGEALGFLFEPLEVEVPSRDKNQQARFRGKISGHVRTWKTAENRLLVVVNARTSVRSFIGNSSLSSTSSGIGSKQFHVQIGEAVKIVIPPFGGYLRLPAGQLEEPLPTGVEQEDKNIKFDAKVAFGHHQLALLIKTSIME